MKLLFLHIFSILFLIGCSNTVQKKIPLEDYTDKPKATEPVDLVPVTIEVEDDVPEQAPEIKVEVIKKPKIDNSIYFNQANLANQQQNTQEVRPYFSNKQKPVEIIENTQKLTKPKIEPPRDKVVKRKSTAISSKPAKVFMQKSNIASAQGKNNLANSYLDRAIGIAPDEPLLWHKKANLALKTGNYQQALNNAYKSNALLPEKPLQNLNLQIIEKAKSNLGIE